MITETTVDEFRADRDRFADFVVAEINDDAYCSDHLPNLDEIPSAKPVRLHYPPQHAFPECPGCGFDG